MTIPVLTLKCHSEKINVIQWVLQSSYYANRHYSKSCDVPFMLNAIMLNVIMPRVAMCPSCIMSFCHVSLHRVSFCWMSLCQVSLCWVPFCWMSLCQVSLCWCHSAECHYAKCHSDECCGPVLSPRLIFLKSLKKNLNILSLFEGSWCHD